MWYYSNKSDSTQRPVACRKLISKQFMKMKHSKTFKNIPPKIWKRVADRASETFETVSSQDSSFYMVHKASRNTSKCEEQYINAGTVHVQLVNK